MSYSAAAASVPTGARSTYLFEVKKPEQSNYAWDYYKLRATFPAAEAFRP